MEMFDREAEYLRIKFFFIEEVSLGCNGMQYSWNVLQVHKQKRRLLKYKFSTEGVF